MSATTKTASIIINHVLAARDVLEAADKNTAQAHRLALALAATSAVDAPALSRQALSFALALEAFMCAADEVEAQDRGEAADDAAQDLSEAVSDVARGVAEELASNVTAYARHNFGHAKVAPKSHPKLVVDCLGQLGRLGYAIDLGDHTAGAVDGQMPCVASTLDRAAKWIEDGIWQFGQRASAEVTATLTITEVTCGGHTAGEAQWSAEAVGIPMPE